MGSSRPRPLVSESRMTPVDDDNDCLIDPSR